jgi:hypothetical protein
MGIHRKTVAYRTDDETSFWHEAVRTGVPWLCKDHTAIIKFCARIAYLVLCTPVTVNDIRELFQRLHCMALQCAASSAPAPVLARIARTSTRSGETF